MQNKIADAAMAEQMMLSASMGHSCGINFKAARHLKAHPDLGWEKDVLRDLDSRRWTTFKASK